MYFAARRLYECYIRANPVAPLLLPLPSAITNKITSFVDGKHRWNVVQGRRASIIDADEADQLYQLFDDAQAHVFKFMENEYFRRFKDTDLYPALLKELGYNYEDIEPVNRRITIDVQYRPPLRDSSSIISQI
eukprot:TRINITY_DN8383_c0_g1_i1.p1 TRINITY_DN8383_c0_g1~~TRINITY_DN8383_c0_g1_i1.p1  ORF type:complete len:133 (-),score=21.69 TRINITY_DN8383_c0_g1_i1:105-503(-)